MSIDASDRRGTGSFDRRARDTDTGAWRGIANVHKASPDEADRDGASMNDERAVEGSPGDGSEDDETADDRYMDPSADDEDSRDEWRTDESADGRAGVAGDRIDGTDSVGCVRIEPDTCGIASGACDVAIDTCGIASIGRAGSAGDATPGSAIAREMRIDSSARDRARVVATAVGSTAPVAVSDDTGAVICNDEPLGKAERDEAIGCESGCAGSRPALPPKSLPRSTSIRAAATSTMSGEPIVESARRIHGAAVVETISGLTIVAETTGTVLSADEATVPVDGVVACGLVTDAAPSPGDRLAVDPEDGTST